MAKQAEFTMRLEPELLEEFLAEADVAHSPASRVVRELMREYVQRQREAREYKAFLQDKVDASRRSKEAGVGLSNAEVEAQVRRSMSAG
ncbi:antitoxin of toxin-antitoxin stability system [Halomonas sp.]|uniref:antitoxin of toxin-antitoxin stability system n=1 Tax=Halomonas sp. TaxID=1486246 RepID=UPI00298DE2DC|nr:antitoxin of toxin-antitoxin stability system [Halomonas sp.]MDW7748260.1 antitoxin of toxin-antitoxin stability system [Halomonas sp.]